jgi:hypothetical protein
MKLYFCALLLIIAFGVGISVIANQEKKCIDGQIHKLVSDKYWQGTGFTCKPLSDNRINEAVT